MTQPAQIEPPDGFQPTTQGGGDPPAEGGRPEWLVGADDGLDADGSLGLPRQATPRPEKTGSAPTASEPPTPWTAAASSIPKLTVVPRRERPALTRALPDDDLATSVVAEVPESAAANAAEKDLALRPPDEPWWLVGIDFLATNRVLQIGLLVGLAIAAAVMFWPRRDHQTAAIARIKQHPERFEGQSVRVRGEVGEVFDVGRGYVFHLHQGRDTMVVFSPARRPSMHDKIVVAGTISTGYLDGVPRVALFETATSARR